MMNISEQVGFILNKIDTDQDGFKLGGWQEAVASAREMAIEIRIDCPDSYDSTEELLFEDGSRLLINNPRQAAFAGESRVLRRK